jgi:hypothetical protein
MSAYTDDYSPMYTGDTGNPFGAIFQHKDGTPFILTGATISMKMVSSDAITIKTCSGTWVVDDAQNGIAHYPWQAADVNTADNWTMFVTITIGGLPVHADTKVLSILHAP